MQGKRTLKTHAALVDRMATAQGLDLEEQMMRGRFTTSELEDAVLRCTGCSAPDACAHWLETQGQAEAAPLYCRNAQVFAELRREAGHG